MSLVEIDGSMGEGGGQILRTSIALAAITGRPLRIFNIRAKRSNPGLRPQHLTAVRAIAALSGGRLEGDRVGSMELRFTPGRIRGGRYRFDVGTAGSVSLVLQALLPVMAYADGPITVEIRGGTDVPMAPTIDYIREVLRPLLAMLGYRFTVRVKRRGHYPKGGGIVEVAVPSPPRGFKARSFTERGELVEARVRSHAVRLPRHVAERQARSASEVLRRELGVEPRVELEWYEPGRDPHLGPGSGVLAWLVFKEAVMGGDSIGKRGKPAEQVGREAAEQLVEDYRTGAALDRHASDMIPVYLALAEGDSLIHGAMMTSHAHTVLELLKLIVEGYSYEILEGGPGKPFKARIRGAGVRA